MKNTYTSPKDRWNTERTVNPYITEARRRERCWLDFRLEMELIGARLRRLRIDKRYSLETAARAIGIPKGRLYKIEHGLYVHFLALDLSRLSQLYGTSTTEILSVIPDGLFEDSDYQI